MKAFLACSAKSRVVEKVEDIDHGWDALSDTNKAFIRSIIDGAPKSQAPRKIQRKPSPPTEKINETAEQLWVPKRGDDCYSLWRGVWYPAKIVSVIRDTYEVHYSGWGTQHDHSTSRKHLRHKDYDFDLDDPSAPKPAPQPSNHILRSNQQPESPDAGRTGLYRSPEKGSDGAPLHNMLDLFAESSDEEDEKDSRKACELRRVGGPWRRFSSRKAAAKAFPGAITSSDVSRLIAAPDKCPRRIRDAFEAREVRSMKRCPACGVERAHPSMFRDDAGRSTKNCKKCPQELEENPYAKTYGKRPTAPPTAHSAPGPAWEHRSVQKRKRPGGLRAAPPTKRRADLGYEPSSKRGTGDLGDVLQAARALAPPPPGSKKTGPVPVKLSAVKVKQLLMTDKADMRGEELCAALDAGGPNQTQDDYGRCGGMLSGRLGPNKFCVDYERQIRSKCKRLRCKRSFNDGELRVGKIPPRARKDVPARRVHWYHPACIFKSFERASKKTKTIDTVDDMEGFSELKEADKADLTSRVAAWVARKAAMNANYKPKKRKRRGGDWLPSPTASFDNEATASFDADGDEDDEPEEADEEAVDLLVGLTQQRPVVERSQHDEGAAELLAALAGSPPPPAAAAPSSTVSETFAVGDVVEANYRGQGHWYPGRIASLDLDGYKIAYDDGENESEVATANVRRAATAPAPVPPPAGGGYVDAVLTAPPASATEIAHSEAQRMFGAPAPAPAEPASTVITPPATQSRPQLDDEKERLRLERDAARRELEALKAQLAAQAPQSA